MQQAVQLAVQVFRANPNASADEILSRVLESGIDRPMAVQLVALLPIAYGRVMLRDDGVRFSDTYICLGEQGQAERRGRIEALPLWSAIIHFARGDGEPFFPIASRSSEIRAANEALRDGKKLRDLVWSPPVFLWPVDSFAGLRRPWWQFWKR
jgi:hypothetical protein